MYTGSQITRKCKAGDNISAWFYSRVGAFSISRFHPVFVSWTWLSQRLEQANFSEKWISRLIKWWEFCFKIFSLHNISRITAYMWILSGYVVAYMYCVAKIITVLSNPFCRVSSNNMLVFDFGGKRVHARTRAARGDLSPVSHLSQALNHLRVSRISLDGFPYLPSHRVGFLRRFGMKRIYTLPTLVWNRVWFSRELRECMNVSIVSIPDE